MFNLTNPKIFRYLDSKSLSPDHLILINNLHFSPKEKGKRRRKKKKFNALPRLNYIQRGGWRSLVGKIIRTAQKPRRTRAERERIKKKEKRTNERTRRISIRPRRVIPIIPFRRENNSALIYENESTRVSPPTPNIPLSRPLPFYLQFHSGFEWAASYRGFNVDASACSQKGEATDDDSGNWVVTAASPRPIYALLRLNFMPAITLLRGERK